MDKLKQPYELSIWQDIWDLEKSAYVDKKVLVIGNDKDKKVYQAQQVLLTRDVNGTSTLTFTMYSQYMDEITGELTDNPYISMLVNERKLKLKYAKDWDFENEKWNYEWKDYFIKTAQASSDKKSIAYTCKDAFITELSKSGFSIELDAELDNNQGTITELATYVLEDTDWKVGASETLQQRVEDYVYEVTTLAPFTGTSLGQPTIVPTGSILLVYYAPVSKESSYLQFLFNGASEFPVDSERIVTGTPEYNVAAAYLESNGKLDVKAEGVTIFSIPSSQTVSVKYKGMRYVRQVKSKLDSVTDKYVTLYKVGNQDIYGYTTTEYLEPLTVTNYVTNNREMVSNAGWFAYANNANTHFLPYVPTYGGQDVPIYLRVTLAAGQTKFLNTGVSDNRGLLTNGIAAGESFTLRMKYKRGTDSGPQSSLKAVVAKYNASTMTYAESDIIFNFSTFTTVNGYAQATMTATKAVPQVDLYGITDKYGIFFIGDSGQTYYLEDMQLFKTIFDSEGSQVYPDTINVTTQFRFLYSYYIPNDTLTSADEVSYLYAGYEPWAEAIPQYDDNFEKIRSITASKSNRFNLIQQLAETFECWALFNIGHNDDGSLKLIEENGIWVPDKTVTFVEFLGQDTSAGFKYGMNLVNIQRNVESEQIVTKLIVEPNSNEFAPDGFCTISHAEENTSRESFLLNFDYFVRQGLLDGAILLRDLYVTIGEQKGYLYSLRHLNEDIKELQDLLPGLYRSLDQQNYLQELYVAMLQESILLASNSASAILQLTKLNDLNTALARVSQSTATETERRYYHEYMTYQSNIATANSILDKVDAALISLNEQVDSTLLAVENLTKEKRVLNLNFYKRYSRYIQEGSWINEDYIDPNLYYLDAQSVLYGSSMPQISYTINVIDLSILPDYRHYSFDLGDKTTIEDVEFFGYSDLATRTPFKEQVILSQIVTDFDNPQNNKITIQNYKSQFQDLFQRITATTNALQYNTGAYSRAAGAVTPAGEIEIETLQNSLLNNALIIASAQNESFIQDGNGITAVDLDNPLNIMKLQSKGMFLSTDGGITWTSGIRATGINTQALTAGSILVDRIFIQGSGGNAFRWDEHGLNAYANALGGGRASQSFVRFDNYGIYGINNSEITDAEYVPESEQDIWDDAQFGMTWKGFFIKNRYGAGWVEMSSDNDFVVNDGTVQRVKMGNVGSLSNPVYGLQIRDEDNTIVMETIDDGTLWLKERLNVSTTGAQTVSIGYLPEVKQGTNVHEVINANDAFVVYEDGSVLGTNVKFTGGTIGGLTIAQVENASKGLSIGSVKGNSFKITAEGAIAPTGGLPLTANLLNLATNGVYTWARSIDTTTWTSMSTDANYTFSYNSSYFDANGVCFIRLTYITSEGTYTAYYTLYVLTNGMDGTDGADGTSGIDGIDGKGISSTVITYQAGTSGTIVPTGTWSVSIPTVAAGQYLWTKTYIEYTDSTNTTAYSVGKMGEQGPQGDPGSDGSNGNDGTNGTDGTPATSVTCGLESVTLACTTARAATGASTITIPFAGYIGTERCACSVAYGTLPTGITLSTNTAATTSIDGSLKFSVASGANLGGTTAAYDNVIITLTFTANGLTFTKKVTISKTITGATGVSATSIACGGENVSIACTSDCVTAASSVITIPFAGYSGTTRKACTISYSALPSGITLGSNTAATTLVDGSLILNVAAGADFGGITTAYNNVSITLTLITNGVTFVKILNISKVIAGAIGPQGQDGIDGKDGKDGASYRIETNQNEVLCFASDSGVSLSPLELTTQIYPYEGGNGASPFTSSTVSFSVSLLQSDNTWLMLDPVAYASYLHFDTNNYTFIFDVQGLISGKYGTSMTNYTYVKEMLESGSGTIRIQAFLKTDNSLMGQVLIPITWGNSESMAKLSLFANQIYASIQSTALTFDANGLHVRNGGLNILNNSGEEVFGADVNGDLDIKGKITATSGSFTGAIDAQSGTLRDLLVNGLLTVNNYLSIDGRVVLPDSSANPQIGIYSSNYSLESGSGFFLSEAGTIYASSIVLGKGATISDYIKLGNAWILNPATNNSHFLRVGDSGNYSFLVKEDGSIYSAAGLNILGNANYIGGTLKVGNASNYVLLNGIDQSMSSSDYVEDGMRGWSLRSDGTAILNHAIVRGSIKSSVLESAEVQAIGGIMLVRPSSIIKTAVVKSGTTITLTLEDATGFEEGDYCEVQGEGFTSSSVTWFNIHLSGVKNQVEITYAGNLNNLIGRPLVDFGREGSVGIGINSSANNSLVAPNAVSIFTLNMTTSTPSINTKIILGKIPNEAPYGPLRNSYGLYAENVYLKGALVSEYEGTSGGIDTRSTIQENSGRFSNQGNILLWAGATSLDPAAIQQAKFRVDSLGNVFASSGYFSGTIITDATITAAEIRTATITGISKNESTGEYGQAALTIRDADIGISFVSGQLVRAQLSNQAFILNNVDLTVGSSFYVGRDSRVEAPQVSVLSSRTGTRDAIITQANRIDFLKSVIELPTTPEAISVGAISYNNGLNLIEGGDVVMNLLATMATMKPTLMLESSLRMTETTELKPVKNGSDIVIGYDLYINN